MNNKVVCECSNFNCFFGQEMAVAYSQCPCCSDTLIPVNDEWRDLADSDVEHDE